MWLSSTDTHRSPVQLQPICIGSDQSKPTYKSKLSAQENLKSLANLHFLGQRFNFVGQDLTYTSWLCGGLNCHSSHKEQLAN